MVTCPTCGGAVRGDDIDLASNRAVCRPCGEVLPLPSSASLVVARSTLAFQPTGLKCRERVVDSTCSLTVAPPRGKAAWRTASWAMLLAVPLTMFEFGKAALAVALPWMIAAAIATLFSSRRLFNRARITVDREHFRVRFGPIPSRGAVELPIAKVIGLEPYEQTDDSPWASRNNQRSGWGVAVLTLDGRRVEVRLDLASEAHAAYVAARLGKLLDEARAPAGYRR